MEKVDLLVNVMELAVKIDKKDVNISKEVNALSGVTDVDVVEALHSLEETLTRKATSDDAISSYLLKNLDGKGLVDVDFIISSAEFYKASDSLDVENVKNLLKANKKFKTERNTIVYHYFLSKSAIATGDSSVIELAIERLHQLQGGI